MACGPSAAGPDAGARHGGGAQQLSGAGDAPRRWRIAAFDAEPALIEPGRAIAPLAPRKRGRPRNSLTPVVLQASPISADDMAWLRAWVQGVPVAQAGRYYAAGEAGADGRSARGYLQRLLARLGRAAGELREREAASAYLAELLAPLPPEPARGAAAREASVREASAREASAREALPRETSPRAAPTLEDFAQRFDPDMYSEAELIELYEQEWGQGGAPVSTGQVSAVQVSAAQAPGAAAAAAPTAPSAPVTATATATAKSARQAAIERKLAILDWLAPRVGVAPSAASPLAAWLGRGLAQDLGAHLGLASLADLARWINARGRWWYEQVPGLGRQRAERLVAWLAQRSDVTGVAIDRRVLKTLKLAQHGPALAQHGQVRAQHGQMRAQPPAPAGAHRIVAGQGGAGNAGAGQGGAGRGGAGQGGAGSAGAGQGGAGQGGAGQGGAGQGSALVPLEHLDWPAQLLGGDGLFRARTPNTLGARSDREAVAAWLDHHLAGKSEATQLVYRRAIERLVLWALMERRCALSSLTVQDLGQFRQFLYQPPAHWCGEERVVKYSADWRPLRGPLSETAVRQVLGVVKAMFHAWHVGGYLSANSADGVGCRPSRELRAAGGDQRAGALCARQAPSASWAAVTLEASRSFVKEDLQAMRRTLQEMPQGPARRRLRAILLLLLTTGLRRSECERLSFGMIEPVRQDNQLTGAMKIRVLGKGGKVREVPLKAATLAALEDHYQDRMALAAAGRLPARWLQLPKHQAPLLSVLREVRASGAAGQGDSTAAAARRVNFEGRLDGASIYSILKAFFAKVGAREDLVHGQAAFQRASTHWMRHTFALAGLAAAGNNSLATVQALLGHSSIATTGLYLKAHMGERVRMVEAIEAVF